MMIDIFGLPRENGAGDSADSARLAGMMAMVNHPKTPALEEYFVNLKPVRHPYYDNYPENHPRCMSRDQLVCLAEGLACQGSLMHTSIIADNYRFFAPNNMHEKWVKNGQQMYGKWKIPDLLSPSVNNHFKLCAGRKGFGLGYKWLEFDIEYNGTHTPMGEQNQLQCLVNRANIVDPKGFWINKYIEANPKFDDATMKYWYDTNMNHYNRGERELGEMIVGHFKKLRR